MKKAVVLLSGGIDSATTLYWAKQKNYACFCLIFDYGQRHKKEIKSAILIAKKAKSPYEIIKIRLPWKGSSLLDKRLEVPQRYNVINQKRKNLIPSTYVPARNIIFLSFALSFAEAIGAKAIFIGAHTHDYSDYPDCRIGFFKAFQEIIKEGTAAGINKKSIKIYTPIINKNKAEIIKLAKKLGVPLELTWSCYHGKRYPCGKCDSCYFRAKGFQELGIKDPLLVISS